MEGSGLLTCTHCGVTIGAYEPLWWRRADGTVSPSSYLRVRQDPAHRDPDSDFFHHDCLAQPPTSP
jgi:hypothetical protein